MDFKDFFLVGAGKKLEKAYIYIDSGKYDKARSLLEPALIKDQQNIGLMLAILQCFVFEKRHTDAATIISKILMTDKDMEHEVVSVLKSAGDNGEDPGPSYSCLADYKIKHRDTRKAFEYIFLPAVWHDYLSANSLSKKWDE